MLIIACNLGCAILVLPSRSGSSSHSFQKDSPPWLEAGKYHADRKSWRHRENWRFRRLEKCRGVSFTVKEKKKRKKYNFVEFVLDSFTYNFTEYYSRIYIHRLTNSSIVCRAGSFRYMAPEMLRDQSYDFKCDIWSMGVILYEMVTKRHPFPATVKSHKSHQNSQFEFFVDLIFSNFSRPCFFLAVFVRRF